MKPILIVDYGMANLRSVQKAFEKVGSAALITSDPQRVREADKVVLPGVGAFCDAIARPEWKSKAEWKTSKGRSADRAAINAAIGAITREKAAQHWIELFEGAGIPCGPINTIDQAFADPQVRHLGMATPMRHPRLGDVKVVASPITMEGVAKDIRLPTPEAGAHTDEVLRAAGFADADIAEMRRKGVV